MTFVPPKPDDTVAWLTIRMRANGALSIEGHLADKRFALQLLDHARDAITSQLRDGPIAIPPRDVALSTALPLREVGDMPSGERGDP